MKPQQIIELEKELGFELRETKNPDEVMKWEKSKIFSINKSGKITALSLWDCEIVDGTFLKKFNYLKNLNLRYNYISDISFLKKLINLEKLYLGANTIDYFDQKLLDQLPNLKELYLYGNTIQNIPEEIFNFSWNCLYSLKDYFQSIENPEDRQELNEAKLIFVGRGMVGKTELADAISEENYVFNPKRPSTEAIRIKTWQITDFEKEGKKADFSVNIWDFAGQEINYGTHQFFLTKNSLYVLVWRSRVDDPSNRFGLEYWLNIIQLLSNGSPVLVVKNWIDEDGDRRINEVQWKEQFPNIVGFYYTSCKDGRGIKEVAADIRKYITLPHTSEVWNKNRFALRKEIEQIDENYISYADYLRTCEKHQIDKTSAKFLAEQLHHIGVILYFSDDLRFEDTVILKPEWATQAAYKLIDEKLNPNGHFRISDLKNYWKEEIYEGKHQYLLNLMLRFYLIFNISRTDEYIVPDLLPENPPDNLPILPQENRLRFEYHYDFMPKSLLSHFICLNASYIQGNYLWKNGVFLQQNGSRAKVETSELLDYIRIEVSGEHSAEFLTILRSFIQTVHRNILEKEPDFKEVIPCPCSECQKELEYKKRHFFPYNFLRKLKEKGLTSATCIVSADIISIDLLLTGIEPLKSKEDLILEKLESIKADTEQILQVFSQEFSEIKLKQNLQEEERFRLLGELIDKQKPQNLNNYAQKAQIEFSKFNSLQAESKIFLSMAFYFLEILPDSGDFSPVALQFCRALELEMKAVFDVFKNSTFKTLPNYPTQNNETYKHFYQFMEITEDKIALGQMLVVVKSVPSLQHHQLFQDFDNFLNHWKNPSILSQFLAETDIFTQGQNSPRNKSAHTHPLSKLEAEDCKGLVLRSLNLILD